MIDYETARIRMVDSQIRPNSVTDYEVIAAFLSVPREEFVPSQQKPFAYIDEDLPLSGDANARYLMEAMTFAKLVQLAEIEDDNIVLDVGCATGYSSAVLSRLCTSVVALESNEMLAQQATDNLSRLGFDNAVVVTGPLQDGYAKEGPYDVIFVEGSVEVVPEKLLSQLKSGGRLVVVEGHGNTGVAKLHSVEDGVVTTRKAFNSAVMPLPGFEREKSFVF